jgi:hypothetical protein
MSFELNVTTVADADAVLAAIRTEAGYWRESMVPTDLRRRGALGVEVKVVGRKFVLSLTDLSRDPPPSEYELRGEVTPLAAGGSRIRATPEYRSREWISFALLAALAVAVTLGGQWIAGPLLFIGSGGIYWHRAHSHAVLSRESDIGVHHLAERLELALSSVDRTVARGGI